MKQLYITFLFLLYCTLTFAQKNFREGYVVQGTDTLRGYVDYRGDVRSSQAATFKVTLEGSEQVFTADDIAGYGFEKENKAFESKTIVPGAQTNSALQTLFMNVLVKGRASIYSYRDSHSMDHYYLQKDTLFVELVQHKREQLDPKTGRIHLVNSKVYRSVLNMAFTDCATLSASQLEQVNLLHRDLINITEKYNQCIAPTEAAVSYKHREKKAVVTIGPVLVYTQAKLQFSGTSFYPLINTVSLHNKTPLGGGVSVNAVLPYMSEKLSIQAELLYISQKFTDISSYANSSTETRYTFELAYLKLPVQLRYTYPKGTIRPFVNAGYLVAYAVKDKNEKHTISSGSSTSPAKSQVWADDTYRRGMDGLSGGIGMMIPVRDNALFLEGRYEWDRRFSNRVGQGSRIENYSILLSYGF